MAKVQTRQIPLHPPLDCEFQLGDWHVYPTLNRLQLVQQVQRVQQNSSLIRQLEPRLMHLLCFLAANQLQVLDRDQLTSELWPTVIVNENSLTRAISELRKQLSSDSTTGSRYLQTISKRGYRLAVDVQIVNAAHPKLVPFLVRRHRTRSMTLLATAASLTLATGIFLSQIPANDPTVVPVQVANATVYDRVMDTAPGVGVNTSLVTLDSDVAGNPGTFKYTDQQLSHEKPVVSSDGTTIAFIRYDSSGSTIFLGNLDAVKPPLAIFNSKEYLYNLSWSPVGPALLFAAKPLSRINAVLGEKRYEANLLMLDLETLEVNVLLDNTGSKHAPATNEVNLT